LGDICIIHQKSCFFTTSHVTSMKTMGMDKEKTIITLLPVMRQTNNIYIVFFLLIL